MRRLFVAPIFALWVGVSWAQEEPPLDPFKIISQSLREDVGTSLGAAELSKVRPLLPLALSMIKDFEGWFARAYDDPAGYCTIGYGRLIALKRCTTITLEARYQGSLTEAQGAAFLEEDTASARSAVGKLVTVDLSNEQFSALASFTFNVDKKNFETSTMRKLINRNEFDAAAGQFMRWIKADGNVLPGLVTRRACEEALFRKQLKGDRNGRFNRSYCSSRGIAADSSQFIDINQGE